MQGRFAAEYWKPTRESFLLSLKAQVERLRDRQPPTPGDVEAPPRKRGWAEEHLGKVLSCDKFRLSRKEAFEKFWAKSRFLTPPDNERGKVKIHEAGVPDSRGTVYDALFRYAHKKNIPVKFRDGVLIFPAGTVVADLITLADLCDLHPQTVAAALEDLQAIGVIHYTSTWNGTIIQIVGYYLNRPTNPYVQVHTSWPAIEASLRVRPAEAPPPKRGVKSAANQAALDTFLGRRRPPPA